MIEVKDHVVIWKQHLASLMKRKEGKSLREKLQTKVLLGIGPWCLQSLFIVLSHFMTWHIPRFFYFLLWLPKINFYSCFKSFVLSDKNSSNFEGNIIFFNGEWVLLVFCLSTFIYYNYITIITDVLVSHWIQLRRFQYVENQQHPVIKSKENKIPIHFIYKSNTI